MSVAVNPLRANARMALDTEEVGGGRVRAFCARDTSPSLLPVWTLYLAPPLCIYNYIILRLFWCI